MEIIMMKSLPAGRPAHPTYAESNPKPTGAIKYSTKDRSAEKRWRWGD